LKELEKFSVFVFQVFLLDRSVCIGKCGKGQLTVFLPLAGMFLLWLDFAAAILSGKGL
jgi:hypothetical protein